MYSCQQSVSQWGLPLIYAFSSQAAAPAPTTDTHQGQGQLKAAAFPQPTKRSSPQHTHLDQPVSQEVIEATHITQPP
jgi:hypothetical protein